MPVYQFYREQQINANLEKVWDFISTPKNLQKITPEYMGFEITTNHFSEVMYPGMIITYKVRPIFNIPMTWVTEITHVKNQEYFVDEQRVGPYAMWHHEHILIKNNAGVLMKDLVTYKPPMGILGAIANSVLIKKQLNNIFDYRSKVVDKIFSMKAP